MRVVFSNRKPIFAREKRAMVYFLLLQCLTAVSLFGFAALYWNHTVALSVALGGVLSIVPTIFLGLWFFLRKPQKMMRDLYIAELIKLVLIGGLFIAMLRYFDVQLLPFLLGFCGVYAVYFLAPTIMKGI